MPFRRRKKKKGPKRRDRVALITFTGDVHSNSKLAVCPAKFARLKGDGYEATKYQRWIYGRWLEYWEEIWELKKRLKWPLYCVYHGELADDNKHSKTDSISKNPADVIKLAAEVLKIPLEIGDFHIVLRGTEAHVGVESWMDEQVAVDISAVKISDPDEESITALAWRAKIAGVRFDVAHHPGHGHMRPWTKGGDANRLAADVLYRYAEHNHSMRRQGERELATPDIVYRGHNHKPSDSGDNHPIRAIITPSWQLGIQSGFGHRLGGNILPIGGDYVSINKGIPTIVKKHWRWPLSDYWIPED